MACASRGLADPANSRNSSSTAGNPTGAPPVWNGGFGASGRPGVARLPPLARRRRRAVGKARQPASRGQQASALVRVGGLLRQARQPGSPLAAQVVERTAAAGLGKPAGQVGQGIEQCQLVVDLGVAGGHEGQSLGLGRRVVGAGHQLVGLDAEHAGGRVTVRSLGTDRPASMWESATRDTPMRSPRRAWVQPRPALILATWRPNASGTMPSGLADGPDRRR